MRRPMGVECAMNTRNGKHGEFQVMTDQEQSLVHDLVIAEFEYIGKAAFHNNEERARASQLFFITFLTLVAAVYSSQLEHARLDVVYRAFAILFVILTAFGALTLLQLARFREAWMDAAAAMYMLKKLAFDRDEKIKGYFMWSALPQCLSFRSVGFLIAVSVSLLSGVAVGATIAFLALASHPASGIVPWGWSVGVGLALAVVLLGLCYCLPLLRYKIPEGVPQQSKQSKSSPSPVTKPGGRP